MSVNKEPWPSIEEIKKLISFRRDHNKEWYIMDIFETIHGDVQGNIEGNIYGRVMRTVVGSVDGDVQGNIGGTVTGDI